MSHNKRTKTQSSYIPRIVLKNIYKKQVALYNEPSNTKFKIIKQPHSILNINKTQTSRILPEFKNNQNNFAVDQVLKASNNKIFYRTLPKYIFSPQTFDKLNQNIPIQNLSQANYQQKVIQSTQIKDQQSQTQTSSNNKNKKQNKVSRKLINMSYEEYEKLMKKSDLTIKYFQKIAKRNDEKHLKITTLMNDIQNQKIKYSAQRESNKKQKMMMNFKKNFRRFKTHENQSIVVEQNKIIVGSEIGTFSNKLISQILEKNQKQRIEYIANNPNSLLTHPEQSDSEEDFHKKTEVKKEFLKQNSDLILQKQNAIKTKLYPFNQNQVLHKILHQKDIPLQNADFYNTDFENDYDIMSKRLLTFQNIYTPKQYLLTHKAFWKV